MGGDADRGGAGAGVGGSRTVVAVGVAAALAVLALRVARTWFLVDDAFISFRYARNLLLGRGLVWNVGEAVEGYTNLLWILQLAAIEAVAGLRPEQVAAWLGVAWTAVALVLVAALARATGRPGAAPLAVALLATNRSFAIWSTGGLETRSFTALVLATVLATTLAARGRARPEVASLLAATAALSRPEGAVLGALVVAAWPFLQQRDPGVRSLARVAAPLVLVVGAHLAWRHATYGAWLPNTAVAKVNGAWWDGGLRWLGVAALEHGLLWTAPLALAGVVGAARRGIRGPLVGAAFGGALVLELAYAGGDHFEHRLLDPVFALVAAPAADALVGVASRARRAALVAATLLVTNALPVAEDLVLLRDAPDARYVPAAVPDPADYAALAVVPLVGRGVDAWVALSTWCVRHAIGTRWPEHAAFGRLRVAQYACWEAATDQGLVPDDAVVAQSRIGAVGYFLKDTVVVDRLGLTDATVARSPVPPPADRQLAHEHAASGAYLHARGVNLDPLPCADRPFPGDARLALAVDDGVWAPLELGAPAWFARPAWRGRLHRAVDAAGRPLPMRFPPLHDEVAWSEGPRPWRPVRRLTPAVDVGPTAVIPAWQGPGPALAWTPDPTTRGRRSSAFAARAGERLGLALPPEGDVEVAVVVDGVEARVVRAADAVDGRVIVDLDALAGREVTLHTRAAQPDGDAPLLAVLLLDRPPWTHAGEPGWPTGDPTAGRVVDTLAR